MDSVWPAPSEIITTGKKNKGERRDKKDSDHRPWDIPVPKGSVMDSVWPAPSEIITTGKKGARQDKKGSDHIVPMFMKIRWN